MLGRESPPGINGFLCTAGLWGSQAADGPALGDSTIVPSQPSGFMTCLALTPHKLEHFKGAMTLPACLLSLITPGQPTAVPHQKTKEINPPNSNPKI